MESTNLNAQATCSDYKISYYKDFTKLHISDVYGGRASNRNIFTKFARGATRKGGWDHCHFQTFLLNFQNLHLLQYELDQMKIRIKNKNLIQSTPMTLLCQNQERPKIIQMI